MHHAEHPPELACAQLQLIDVASLNEAHAGLSVDGADDEHGPFVVIVCSIAAQCGNREIRAGEKAQELCFPSKICALTGVAVRFHHDRFAVERLIHSTGSSIETAGIRFYQRLICSKGHVAATLRMMAHWDLQPLERDLPGLKTPLTLVVGGNDRTVSPTESERVRALLPGARVVSLQGLGHLAHEERPRKVMALITRLAYTPSGAVADLERLGAASA